MPTGYTSEIAKDITFEKFAMQCARAFGALITMRDEPNDAEIPESFEPSSSYTQWREDAEAELQRLQAMTLEEAAVAAKAAYEEAFSNAVRRQREATELKAKYTKMLEQVNAWEPPTPDHQGLKKFMIEQITSSISFDCDSTIEYAVKDAPKLKPAAQWRADAIAAAARSVAHYVKSESEEIQRAKDRTEWVQKLRQSLKSGKERSSNG